MRRIRCAEIQGELWFRRRHQGTRTGRTEGAPEDRRRFQGAEEDQVSDSAHAEPVHREAEAQDSRDDARRGAAGDRAGEAGEATADLQN